MRIIPAIDVIDGKCVRLAQGDYAQQKVYSHDPLEVAKSFEDAGLQFLHLVDLDGARAGKVTNWKVIESITGGTSLVVDFGGGIKTDDEVKRLFETGVSQINVGSIAVKDPSIVQHWIGTWGGEQIILSADVKDGIVAIGGWMESSSLEITDFIGGYEKKGLKYVTCTDISTDGMLRGPNVKLYEDLTRRFPATKLIASGGVSSLEDLLLLRATGVDGAIVGKAIYEGRITLTQLAELAH